MHMSTSLYDACQAGDLDLVRRCLIDGADVEQTKQAHRSTPLVVAAANGYLQVVVTLLQAGARVDAELSGGGTALLHACHDGHVAVVNILLAAGADFLSQQSCFEDATPLQAACLAGRIEVAELLLDYGAPLNATPQRRFHKSKTPLYVAAENAHLDTVTMLLRRGADANLASFQGQPLYPLYASMGGPEVDDDDTIVRRFIMNQEEERARDSIFHALVNAGANMHDGKACWRAASLGRTAIIKAFIEEGVDLCEIGLGFDEALPAAAGQGHIEVVSMLLEAGADVNFASGTEPPALLQAIYAGNEAMTQILLDAGADTEVQSFCVYYSQLTPLRLASRDGHVMIVESLLEAGAAVDYSERDPLMYDLDDGEEAPEEEPTALWLACRKGHVDVVKLLLDAGADVNATAGSMSALVVAMNRGREEVVQELVRRGARGYPNDYGVPVGRVV